MATKTKPVNGIKILGKGKIVQVPLDKIEIAERPAAGEEASRFFYNPRSLDSFSPEEMDKLYNSIRRHGLQQQPIVRAFTDSGKRSDPVIRLELVAGERRLRTIQRLVESKELCYDDEIDENVIASDLYGMLPVRLLYNISDEKALQIAFIENNEHKSLSIKEEIELVERLLKRGLRQEEISETLSTNITWVSQTHNFRHELPPDAFQKLLDGKMTRHVAVRILSYKPEDRLKVFEQSVIREIEDTKAKKEEITQTILEAEDEEEILAMREEVAEDKGDEVEAKRQKRKRKAIQRKIDQAQEKKKKIESEAGVIRQGHLTDGAQSIGVAPKKAKILTRQQIEQFYVKLPGIWAQKGDKVDPICEQIYPKELLEVMIAVADAILTGQHDSGRVIRQIMVDRGLWERKYEEEDLELLDVPEGDEEILDDNSENA